MSLWLFEVFVKLTFIVSLFILVNVFKDLNMRDYKSGVITEPEGTPKKKEKRGAPSRLLLPKFINLNLR